MNDTPTKPQPRAGSQDAREIRVKVAELMGAKRYKRPWDNKVFLCAESPNVNWDVTNEPITIVNSDIPAYDTSCDAAMGLVEALRKEGLRVNIEVRRTGKWSCSFWRVLEEPMFTECADTLPLAICLAFLATKHAAAQDV